VGAYLGWRLTILNIFLGVLSGSLIGIFLMLRQGKRDMQMLFTLRCFPGHRRIAVLLVGSQMIEWYTGFYR